MKPTGETTQSERRLGRALAGRAGVFFLVVLLGALGFLLLKSSGQVLRLAARADQAASGPAEGRYAIFDRQRRLTRDIKLADLTLPSLTPPFPSSLRFDLQLPAFSSFEFSTGLVTFQPVTRARLQFIVEIDRAGEKTTVFAETLEGSEANRWHHQQIDLGPWSGQRVSLTLKTQPVPIRDDIPWADRVQTVWGEPLIASKPFQHVRRRASAALVWLRKESSARGVTPDDRATLVRFSVDLLIAGLFAAYLVRAGSRLESTPKTHPDFGAVLSLFTLTTTLVIFVVHSSVPLSLGLIGALSIIRFRTPVKRGQELALLLAGVTVGLTLGTSQRLLGLVGLLLISFFFLILPRRNAGLGQSVEFSASGKLSRAGTPDLSVRDLIRDLGPNATLQRLEVKEDQMDLRALIQIAHPGEITGLMSRSWKRLPDFRLTISPPG